VDGKEGKHANGHHKRRQDRKSSLENKLLATRNANGELEDYRNINNFAAGQIAAQWNQSD